MNFQIIDEWKKEGILLNGPASDAEIAACEAAMGYSFPDDFKQFYKIRNGFAEWQMDSKMLSLWPLHLIKNQNKTIPILGFIGFADFNVNGSLIGYRNDKPGIYHNYNLELFCNSFEEFLDHWQRETGLYM